MKVRKGVRARRVVRRFELWPVAKVALFFHLLCYLLTLGVLGLLWSANARLGTVDKALHRHNKTARSGDKEAAKIVAILERCQIALNQGVPVRALPTRQRAAFAKRRHATSWESRSPRSQPPP